MWYYIEYFSMIEYFLFNVLCSQNKEPGTL